MKRILIGIDGNEANLTSRVGVNQYAFELIWSIWRLIAERKNEKYPIDMRVYLRNAPLPSMPPATENFKYEVLNGKGLWIITRLMPYLLKTREGVDRPDVFFTPSHYLPLFAAMPMVCSIMDLGYLESSAHFTKKDFWQLKYWTARSLKVSKYIISISESTKQDIVRHYHVQPEKIVVTYPGYDKEKYKTTNASGGRVLLEKVKSKYSIVNDYVLCLGTLKPSKNIEGLLEAWKQIVNEFPQISLVIAGKKGWLFDSIFEKVEKLGLTEKVIFTDFIDEKEKPVLLSGAKLFVLPSFFEGFGLTALEAMASGIPIVASKVGSIPEVVGDAGILVDPKSSDEIAGGISSVLKMDKKEYNRMVSEGLAQAKKFDWEDTAKKTLEVLMKATIGN